MVDGLVERSRRTTYLVFAVIPWYRAQFLETEPIEFQCLLVELGIKSIGSSGYTNVCSFWKDDAIRECDVDFAFAIHSD